MTPALPIGECTRQQARAVERASLRMVGDAERLALLIPLKTLLDAARGVELRGLPIAPAQALRIEDAIAAFDTLEWQGPHALLLHAAEIAVTRPADPLAVIALSVARKLTLKFLAESGWTS